MTREEEINILYGIRADNLNLDDAYTKDKYDALTSAIKALEQEPKTGHWISHGEHCKNLGVIPSGLGAYKWCSNCDCGIDVSEWHRNNYNFCPNCGAKMVEPQESEG